MLYPVTGEFDRKYVPWVTVFLLLANLGVFFFLQPNLGSQDYGLVPADPQPWSWLTHMFLHGDLGHLLGNMLFLWLVGYVLESGAGHLRFLGLYLGGGLLAVGLFWALNRSSSTPLIGASGAISGIMGAMCLMYGLYRIKVFINLGFFFHYVSLPALALLPFWLGKEIYYMLSYPESNVAFTAHIGGLLGGAFLGWSNRRFLGFDPSPLFHREPDKVSPVLEEAMSAIRRVDFSTARVRLRQVLEKEPDNAAALKQLFFLETRDSQDGDLSPLANRMFRGLLREETPRQELVRIYEGYCHKDPRIVLEPDLALNLASLFLQADRTDLGEPLLARAVKSSVPLQDAPSLLLLYGRHFQKAGMERKSRTCFRALAQYYPDSLEAREVQKEELQDQGTEWRK